MNTKNFSGAALLARLARPALLALLALAAAAPSARAEGGFSFAYRGRIDPKGAAMPETVEAVFSLYAEADGGAPLWSATNAVFPSADGVFQLELAGDGLAAAFTNAGARFLGVALGGGEEQHPRQEILAAPLAARAATAAAPAPGASVGLLDAPDVVAAAATFHGLGLEGPLALEGSGASLQVSRALVHGTLKLRKGADGAHVSVLRNAEPDHWQLDRLETGTTLFTTDSGGLVTIVSNTNDWTPRSSFVPCCATWAIPPGDFAPPFAVDHPVNVWFYPFGASN